MEFFYSATKLIHGLQNVKTNYIIAAFNR